MQQGARLTRRRFVRAVALATVLGAAACGGESAKPSSRQAEPNAEAPAQLGSALTSTPASEATAQSAATPAAQAAAAPSFSNVAGVTPDDVALYFAGRLPGFPGVTVDNYLGYSPADLLESMDTVWLDQVGQRYGDSGLQTIYGIVARNLLDSLLSVYGSQPVVLALDAGHGGNPAVFWDPGSNGTEAQHTRAVVGVCEPMATDSRYASVTVRRIFNDSIGDDFGLPPPQDNKSRAQLVLRNARASMLAYEANGWNRDHPDQPVAVHVVSVHFNANSGGTLVLHEGDDVPAGFERRSIAYGQYYVDHVRPALNASGLLSDQLSLVEGTGLHDDSLMYAPPVRADGSRVNPLTGNVPHGPPRYAMLQASLLEQDYVLGLLRYRGLA